MDLNFPSLGFKNPSMDFVKSCVSGETTTTLTTTALPRERDRFQEQIKFPPRAGIGLPPSAEDFPGCVSGTAARRRLPKRRAHGGPAVALSELHREGRPARRLSRYGLRDLGDPVIPAIDRIPLIRGAMKPTPRSGRGVAAQPRPARRSKRGSSELGAPNIWERGA